MPALLFTILKIIGITVLTVLLALFSLILLVLFVPVRYRAELQLPETDLADQNTSITDSLKVYVRFHWLLYLVRGGISYPENAELVVRIFFFRIFPRKRNSVEDSDSSAENASSGDNHETAKEHSEGEKGNDVKDNKNTQSKEEKKGHIHTYKSEVTETGTLDADEGSGISDSQTENTISFSGSEEKDSTAKDRREKKGLFSLADGLEKIIDKVMAFIDDIDKCAGKIEYTLINVCDKIDMVRDTLESSTFDRAFQKGRLQLGKVISAVKPRHISADILYGATDPGDTAKVLAAVSCLDALTGYDIIMDPDFDNNVAGARISIKGRITLFRIVLSAVRIWFDKDIKRLIKRFGKIMAGPA